MRTGNMAAIHRLHAGPARRVRRETAGAVSLDEIDHDTLLQSIIETAPSAIVVIDSTGRVIGFSPAGETMFGWRHGEIEGKNVSILMLPEDRERHDRWMQRYMATGEARIIGKPRTMHARHRSGERLTIRLSVGEFSSDGERYFVGFIEDRSILAETRLKLASAERALDRLGRLTAMGTLASVIAHDLNQPLTGAASLMEAAELLLDRQGDERSALARRHLRQAAEEIRRAGSIVHRVRALIDRGEPERRFSDFNGAVQEACLIATGGALDPGMTLTLELARNMPPVLMDCIQIQQVIVNLVRNALDAVRTTPDGTIVVRTLTDGDTARVEVVDNGPGIPAELSEALFDPFTTSKADGLGLGLAIARSIADSHGGALSLVSTRPGETILAMTVPVGGRDGEDTRP